MCSDKADVDNTMLINNYDHQPVTIAFYVEYDAVISQKTGVLINCLNISGAIPVSTFGHHETKFAGGWRIRVLYPEFTQYPPTDNPHHIIISLKLP